MANEVKAAIEEMRANMHKKETERIQCEVSRDVSQEVRNWRIVYKEKRERVCQEALDAEVKVNNKLAIIKAARDHGLTPSDFAMALGGKGPPPRGTMGPPPQKTGAKRTASGNTATPARTPTPAPEAHMDLEDDDTPARNTRSRSRTPTGPRPIAPLPPLPLIISQPTPRRALAAAHPPSTGQAPTPQFSTGRVASPPDNGGLTSSMHNPNNTMEVDPGPERTHSNPQQDTSGQATQRGNETGPEDGNKPGPLEAIHGLLAKLAVRIEQVASMVEGPQQQASPEGRPPTISPPVAPTQHTRAARPPTRVDIPRPTNPDDGFNQTEPPRRTWNVVTTNSIAQQANANVYAARAAASQGRTPSGRPTARTAAPPTKSPSNMEVTVLCDGGLMSPAAEAAIRAQRPDTIVKEVQRQINTKVKNDPIQLLAGRWSSMTSEGRSCFHVQCLREVHGVALAPNPHPVHALPPTRPCTNSKVCREPAEALICYKCGGPHRTERHNQECRRIHRDIEVCDCPLKCLLCGNTGHHVRDLKCPKRAEFAPQRSVNHAPPPPQHTTTAEQEPGWTTVGGKKRSRVPARPAYKGAGKGKQASPLSPEPQIAPADNTSSEAQVEWDLNWESVGEEPVPGGWDNTGEYFMGHRPITGTTPRNTTPGPSHV
ncbi:hypothetical protein EI94DRAFT_1871007 [Lactarius quietus]|nr:hypothetical protein EI94DRAFT_1871007 [Lactarius quietus]